MTVSRVINGKNNVAEETRQNVLRVIDELGYVPHLQAQRLASGRTRTIVLHYPLSNPVLLNNLIEMNFINGVARGAAEEGYYFSLITGPLTSSSLNKLCRVAQTDGLILMQIAVQDWRVEFLRETEFPFVMIGRCGNNDGLTLIDMDFERAVIEAYTHLTGLGHRQIGFLTYPEDWRAQGVGPAVRAMKGFKTAVQKFKLPSLSRECLQTIERASFATKSLLAEDSRLTAIVAMHTTLAVGAITALQEMNRKVPNDCSIVGVPVGEESELIIPPLTGIEWSGQEIGHQATKMLIRELNGERREPEQILVPPKLKVRSSTAAYCS